MLVEDGVEVVLVRVEGVFKSSSKPDVATVTPSRVVVSLPELQGSHVPHYKQGASLGTRGSSGMVSNTPLLHPL